MVRLFGYFFGMACVLFLVAAAGVAIYITNVARDLPDYAVLNSYAPPRPETGRRPFRRNIQKV